MHDNWRKLTFARIQWRKNCYMLSTNLASINGSNRKRTARKVISREGLALKELRLRSGLSMKAAGLAVGRSDSFISHLENGRLDIPSEQLLEALLNVYGGMKIKSFFERARKIDARFALIQEINSHLDQLSQPDLEAVLDLVSQK